MSLVHHQSIAYDSTADTGSDGRVQSASVSSLLSPPSEAHKHAAGVAHSYYKCKYRSYHINTVLPEIQECDDISARPLYAG